MAAAPAAQDRNASGTLMVGGVETPLVYAYASAEPGIFDKTKEDIRIILSDVPLSEDDRKDTFTLARLGRRGTAHAVEVTVDATGDPLSGQIYAPAFGGALSLSGMHRFDRPQIARTTISGTLHTQSPGEIGGTTYAYSAEFTATIARPPTAAEIAASVVSPAGVAATRYVDRLRAGRLPAFLETLSPAAAAQYDGTAGAARFNDERRALPADARLTYVKMLSPTTALAIVQGHRRSVVIEYQLPLVLDEGVWKITN